MISPNQVQAVYDRASLLYSHDQIQAALEKMSDDITAKLKDSNPVLLCVMNGAIVTTGQLLTKLDFPLEVDYVHATRYRGETSGSEIHWYKKPSTDLSGRTVLLVDDILDGGITLANIVEYCNQQGASNVYTAVLLDKYQKRIPNGLPNADFVGINVEDHYVFGFGMDYHEYLRNVPEIYCVAPEDM